MNPRPCWGFLLLANDGRRRGGRGWWRAKATGALRCRWILLAAGGADGRRARVLGLLTGEGKRRGRAAMDSAFLPDGGGDAAGFLSMEYASVPALRNRFAFEWGPVFVASP